MFNFKLFDSIAVPPADPNHNIVFVTCLNAEDGVGDLVTMKDLGKDLKKILAGKGYQLYGIAAVGKQGKKYIEPRKKEFETIFDTFSEIDRVPGKDGCLSQSEKEHFSHFFSAISNEISKAACEIAVPYSTLARLLQDYLPQSIHAVVIGEYGDDNLFDMGQQMERAAMGFLSSRRGPRQENWDYGIKINRDNLRSNTIHPEILLEIHAPRFVKSLIGDISLENATAYLNTHEFMIAYPQDPVHTYLFVMTQLYRNIDQTGKLSKPCDFLVPNRSVNRPLMRKLFQDFNITNFAFITDSEQSGCPKADVRVFSNFIERDEDYEKLYFLQPSVAGPSGNSSLSTCIESHNIPQILWFGGMQYDFPEMLLAFIANHLPAGNNSLLYQYFKLGHFKETLTLEITQQGAHEFAQKIADFLKNPQLRQEWQIIRQKIIQHHNFYDALPAIVKGTLAISQSQALGKDPEGFKKALLSCGAIQRLITDKLISAAELIPLSFQKIKYLAEPFLNDLIVNKYLDIYEALKLTATQFLKLYKKFAWQLPKLHKLIQQNRISASEMMALSKEQIDIITDTLFFRNIRLGLYNIKTILSLDNFIVSEIEKLSIEEVVDMTDAQLRILADPLIYKLIKDKKIDAHAALSLDESTLYQAPKPK